MRIGDVRVLGVKHTDGRIQQGVDEEASRANPEVVYHEWPESGHDWKALVKWILLKNPSVVGPAVVYTLSSALKMRRGVSVDSTGTAHLKSECKVAAERLCDEYDADLVNIGMNRVELLKERSWRSALQSWGIFLLTLWIVLAAITSGSYGVLWGLPVLFGLAMIHRKRTLDNVRSLRDEHMATNALNDLADRDADVAFIIVGQKHIEGIATRFGVEGIPTTCRWLSNEAEIGTLR